MRRPMKITTKGQVTIPQHIREKHGLMPHTEIDIIEEGAKIVIVRTKKSRHSDQFSRLRGTATVRMSTDEILRLTRGQE